jgi:DNA-binding response OmpR family regulator
MVLKLKFHGKTMDKKSILIVEDMALTAIEIQQTLKQIGYTVTDIANNYSDALKSIARTEPHLILLDIDIKGEKDGIDLANTLQKTNSIPFIYLTSDNSDETMQRASQTSPSAYLSKPFRVEELKSNLLIAFNKAHNIQKHLISLGNGYHYDTIAKNIYLHKQPIHLSQNEKAFIDILIKAGNNIVPSHIIEEYIWKDDIPSSENTLRTLLYRLRSKLENLSIETIPSFGYRLILCS